MNNDQNLICCPVCTIKYNNYHNACPKCGTPRPNVQNINNVHQENLNQQIPNNKQINNNMQQNINNQQNQYNSNEMNPDNFFMTEVNKSIAALSILSSIILTITLILGGMSAISYLSAFDTFGTGTLILILVGPGLIILTGVYIHQQLKWKTLILQYIQRKEIKKEN